MEESYSPSRPVTPDNPPISALENISLPSNLQEILASIQTKTASQLLSKTPVFSSMVSSGISEEKYSPTAPSYLPDQQEFDPTINLQQGYNLGIKHLKKQIVGQPSMDVSLYTNKDNVPIINSLNPTDESLNLSRSDIDERNSAHVFADVDERIAFKLSSKDVDERFPPKPDEMPILNTKALTLPSSIINNYQLPPPPISNKHSSKLAQLSEEELLSMVPDDILSSSSTSTNSINEKLSSSLSSNTSSDSTSKSKLCTVSQSSVLYKKPPPVMLKDISFSQANAELPIPASAGPSKKPKLEQPPPPGMESFFEEDDL